MSTKLTIFHEILRWDHRRSYDIYKERYATNMNGFWILTFEFGRDSDAKQPIQSSEHHSSAKVSLSRKTTPLIFQSEWSW